MRTRMTIVGALSSAVAVAIVGAVAPVAGQAPAAAAKAPAKSAAKAWTAPRMPWGDPDVSGTWSTDDLRGVPTQRPDQFAGRSELSDEEFAERVAANNQTRTRELNRVGAFRNDVGTRTFRQTSLVVEPADGRIPPMTPEAQARGAAVAAVSAVRAELLAGSQLLRSLHHARRARLDACR